MIKKIKYGVGTFLSFIKREKIRYNLIYKNKIPKLELSQESIKIYNDLKYDGITKIEGKFTYVADYLNKEFGQLLDGKEESHEKVLKNLSNIFKSGRKRFYLISFKDEILESMFFDKNIISAIYNLYRHQPYYRSYPQLEYNSYNDDIEKDIASIFHIDRGIFQLSFQLLLNDINENDTHLQYAVGSMKNRIDIDRYSFSQKKIPNKYKIRNAIGKKGTLYIFNAGTGLHRANYKNGSIRKNLFINMTIGDSIEKNYIYENLNEYMKEKNYPDFIKNTISQISL